MKKGSKHSAAARAKLSAAAKRQARRPCSPETRAKISAAQKGKPRPEGIRHGLYDSPGYRTWAGMKTRCANPRNPGFGHYGGRGIRVCDEWMEFEGFIRDMGPPPPGTSLDRIDVNGNYEPSNCRWATPTTQVRNRRITRMTPALRDEMVAAWKRGERQVDIGARLGFSSSFVSRVVRNQRWLPETTQTERKAA